MHVILKWQLKFPKLWMASQKCRVWITVGPRSSGGSGQISALKSILPSILCLILRRIHLKQVMERETTSSIPMFTDFGTLLQTSYVLPATSWPHSEPIHLPIQGARICQFLSSNSQPLNKHGSSINSWPSLGGIWRVQEWLWNDPEHPVSLRPVGGQLLGTPGIFRMLAQCLVLSHSSGTTDGLSVRMTSFIQGTHIEGCLGGSIG